MRQIFKRTFLFTILFALVLCIDIYVKLSLPSNPYRYISKPLVMILIFGFYLFNQQEEDKKKFWWTIAGICSFLLADIFLINHLNEMSFITGLVLVIIGKSFYSLKFSHTTDFQLVRLVPFLLVIFGYIALLFSYIYDNLEGFLAPILFYFFVSLIMVQMAYLRKNAVSFFSYMMVLIGVEFFVVGESVMALKMFYGDIPYQDILTMLLYGLSQYFIILGILKEQPKMVPVNKV